MNIKQGDKAPEFSAPDQNGKNWTLADYHGQWLLLYFYPKDFTSGCTKEACNFRDNFSELKKYAQVVGVSTDTINSHKKFEAKHNLPFTLLADPEKKLVSAYNADGMILSKRISFLINPEGIIEKVYEHVKPADHAAEVLKDLKDKIK